jgi:hypothetical protein
MFFIEDYIMESTKCKGCINNYYVFDLSDYHSGCAKCGKITYYHPIPVGVLTNHGPIKSYKRVRFGVGKYRYFIGDNCYSEEQIENILKNG